jgi:hypothetical protein
MTEIVQNHLDTGADLNPIWLHFFSKQLNTTSTIDLAPYFNKGKNILKYNKYYVSGSERYGLVFHAVFLFLSLDYVIASCYIAYFFCW